MISYETWCQIRDHHDRQGLTLAQIAKALCLHERTVATWAALSHYEARKGVARSSVLDPFKGQVTRLLDTHPFSAQQIFQRLREAEVTPFAAQRRVAPRVQGAVRRGAGPVHQPIGHAVRVSL